MRTLNIKINSNLTLHRGFTLVEMAIVLIIFGLFLSATLVPLSAQRDLSDYRTARSDLEQIQEALYGYVVAHKILPCPDTDGDGAMNSPCTGTGSIQGNIPWVDLGVSRADPWGHAYQYRVDQLFTTTFTLSANPSTLIVRDSSAGNKVANGVPAVIYSSGKNGGIQPPPASAPDERENTSDKTIATYDQNFVSHDITADFDDVVVWLSTSVLFNRMVSAQVLP